MENLSISMGQKPLRMCSRLAPGDQEAEDTLRLELQGGRCAVPANRAMVTAEETSTWPIWTAYLAAPGSAASRRCRLGRRA